MDDAGRQADPSRGALVDPGMSSGGRHWLRLTVNEKILVKGVSIAALLAGL
jgi:hypothetical protein